MAHSMNAMGEHPTGATRALRERRLRRPLLWFVAAFLGLALSCGSPMTTQQATELLVERLWTEDGAVQAICRDLNETGGTAASSPFVSSRISPVVRQLLAREAVTNLSALLMAFELGDEACSAPAIVSEHLRSLGLEQSQIDALALSVPSSGWDRATCTERLDERFSLLAAADPSADPRQLRIHQALRDAGMTASALLDDPVAVARFVDFSPALVFSVVYFSDRLTRVVQDMAGSFAFAQGMVSLVLEEIAAELLALTVETVLDELEATTLVNPVSVSRSACRVFETASFRPDVTVRLLRRMILRMRAVPPEGQMYYPLAVYCDRLSPRKVCEDMLESLDMDPILEADSEASGSIRYQSLAPSPPADAADVPAATAGDRAEVLLDAASLCPEPCTASRLNSVASLLVVAEARQSPLRRALVAEQVEQLEAVLRTDLGAMRGDVDELQQQIVETQAVLSGLVNMVREGGFSATQLRRDLIETLSRLTECQTAFERVRQARLDFANDVMQVDPPVGCDGDPAIVESARFPGVRIPSAMICDPTQPLDFDIATDGLFETCEAEPLLEGASRLASLADALVDLRPQVIVVIGHADERPIETRECSARFENNTLLSEARAEAVRVLLLEAVTRRLATGLNFRTTGVGDVDPRVHCGERAGDECHRLNRRVALRLVGARGLDFDLRCVGGR